ncbi:IS3 family transposase [Lysinibacillus fusiformis]|uniref:IS3 family transposase n=1 Tax=Lysinibacillus sp. PWR01 TaxID=3342384 RepID=UPI00372CE88A
MYIIGDNHYHLNHKYTLGECLYLLHADSEQAIIQTVEEYIYFYNYQRFLKEFSHLTPINIDAKWLLSFFKSCLVDKGKSSLLALWCIKDRISITNLCIEFMEIAIFIF